MQPHTTQFPQAQIQNPQTSPNPVQHQLVHPSPTQTLAPYPANATSPLYLSSSPTSKFAESRPTTYTSTTIPHRTDERSTLPTSTTDAVSTGRRAPPPPQPPRRFSQQDPQPPQQSRRVSQQGAPLQQQAPRLSQQELQYRYDQKLCYKCGDKYSPTHDCPYKQFRLMLCESDVIDEEDFTGDAEEVQTAPTIELSSHSVAGFNSPKTMKLQGIILGEPVIILIDCGATNSFLSQKLVSDLALPVQPKPFIVTVGIGKHVRGGGICKNVKLKIGEFEFLQDYLVFQLGQIDVILGMDWLSTLGIVQSDWNSLTMWFDWKGQPVTLQGDPFLDTREVSHKSIRKILKESGMGYLIELEAMDLNSISEEPPEISSLLQHYPQLFEKPKSLPPCRTHDHAIKLIEGATPPSIRPYRYPHRQKNEVERQVHEMLQADIIRPSVSPFSSPVLLVQKKDGGWRF